MCPSAGLDVRYKKETCAAGGFGSHCQCFFSSSAKQKKPVRIFFSRWVGLPIYFSLFTDYNLAAVISLGGVNIYHRRQCCPLRLAPRPGEVDNVRWKHDMTSNTALDPSKSYDAYGFVYLILFEF